MLDECDEMLNMGFVEDVEKILGAGNVPAAVQTLLFSATLPAWVKDITARFLRPDHRVIDLVGNQRMKVRATGTTPPQLRWHISPAYVWGPGGRQRSCCFVAIPVYSTSHGCAAMLISSGCGLRRDDLARRYVMGAHTVSFAAT